MELQGFPERLREAIAAADLTIAETAKLSGLALSTVQFYLSGRRDNPSGENVLALSTVLGCGAGGWLRSPVSWTSESVVGGDGFIEIIVQLE